MTANIVIVHTNELVRHLQKQDIEGWVLFRIAIKVQLLNKVTLGSKYCHQREKFSVLCESRLEYIDKPYLASATKSSQPSCLIFFSDMNHPIRCKRSAQTKTGEVRNVVRHNRLIARKLFPLKTYQLGALHICECFLLLITPNDALT